VSTIDDQGRSPLDAYKETGCKKHLSFGSGRPREPHELSLVGAASVNRPYGTPLQDGVWETPVWKELLSKGQSEQIFEFLLSLPELFPNEANPKQPSLFVMFMASYDWSIGFATCRSARLSRSRNSEVSRLLAGE
jgi:hypothetical protein